MIIQSSNIDMSGKRNYSKSESSFTMLTTWGGTKDQDTISALPSIDSDTEESQSFPDRSGNTFSDSMSDIMNRFQNTQRLNAPQITDTRQMFRRLHLQTFNYLMRLFFGDKFSTVDQSADSAFVSDTRQAFGGHYESAYYYNEQEYTEFQTTGTAVTADGRKINFDINLQLSRQFMEYSNMSIDFGSAKLTDPLVINLDGNPSADIGTQTFRFDIDADGELDTISTLGPGSGFLALDKNEDGIINDGSELFGTTNGNGFADLAQYDSDGNGWIDEADEVFNRLRIWTKSTDGTDILVGLGAAGVGAIYLGTSDTEFSLNSLEDNATNAVIRQTGIFLYENGGVGTIQQLDMAKHFSTSS